MIIKSFKAHSAVRALKQVREELGPEAIVLKTRQIHTRAGGTMVEITACLEKPTVGTANSALKKGHAGGTATAVPTDVAARLRSKPLPLPEDDTPEPVQKPTRTPGIARNRIKEFVPERIVRQPEEAKRLLNEAMPNSDAEAAETEAAEPVTSPKADFKPEVEDLPIKKDDSDKSDDKQSDSEAKADTAPDTTKKPTPDENEESSTSAATDDAQSATDDTESVPTVDLQVLETLHTRLERIESGLQSLTTRVTSAAVIAPPGRHGRVTALCDQLRGADFTDDFINCFAADLLQSDAATESIDQTARKALVERVADLMVPHFDFVAGDRIAFIGPAGSGKSSVMGKLAFRLVVKDHMKTRLATLDNQKMGAHDEIASYADILDVPLLDTAKSGAQAMSSESETNDPEAVTLIDTPALPTDADDMDRLQLKLERFRPNNCFLVVSSLMRSSDVVDMCRRAAQLAPSHVILTMTDQTWRLGPAVAAAAALERKIAFVNSGPGGIGQLATPDPNALVRTVLKAEVGLE